MKNILVSAIIILLLLLFMRLNFTIRIELKSGSDQNFKLIFGLPLALLFSTSIAFFLGDNESNEISNGKYKLKGETIKLLAWLLVFSTIIGAVKVLT